MKVLGDAICHVTVEFFVLSSALKFSNNFNIDPSFLSRRYRSSFLRPILQLYKEEHFEHIIQRFPRVCREKHFDNSSGKKSLFFPEAVLHVVVVAAPQLPPGVLKYHLGNRSGQQLQFQSSTS